MSEALVTVPREEPQGLAEVVDLGKIFHQLGMFPSNKSAAQAVVKILAGRELGFGPIASMQGIQMIQGKPTLSANMMAALVKRSGRYDFRVRQNLEEVCSIEFYDRGEAVGFSTFTKQDAAKAGLLGGDNWRKYFRNMAFARALSNGVKWYCPDVTVGNTLYFPDELQPGSGVSRDDLNAVYEAEPVESAA